MTEYWLLAYEGVKKGWLTPPETNLLDNNLFFKILKDKNIEFYDPTKQLQIYGTDTTSSQIPPIVNAGILSMY